MSPFSSFENVPRSVRQAAWSREVSPLSQADTLVVGSEAIGLDFGHLEDAPRLSSTSASLPSTSVGQLEPCVDGVSLNRSKPFLHCSARDERSNGCQHITAPSPVSDMMLDNPMDDMEVIQARAPEKQEDGSQSRRGRLVMGFRADCVRCQNHESGHYSHFTDA